MIYLLILIMNKKYYYDDIDNHKFPTLWNGFLRYSGISIPSYTDFSEQSDEPLSNVLEKLCKTNFYISLIDNYIYMSRGINNNFYYTSDFEKFIKSMIRETEKKFDVVITDGEFYAKEVKHNGTEYKYNILKDDKDKIILKRKTLNFNDKLKN